MGPKTLLRENQNEVEKTVRPREGKRRKGIGSRRERAL